MAAQAQNQFSVPKTWHVWLIELVCGTKLKKTGLKDNNNSNNLQNYSEKNGSTRQKECNVAEKGN